MHRFRFASLDGKEEKAAARPQAKPSPQSGAPPHAAGPLHLPLQLPAITEKDMQTARAEAQAQGYREGYAAAQGKFNKEAASREEAVKSLLEVVANRITIAADGHAQAMKERESLMAKLVVAAARKVAGDALRRDPYVAVESLLRDCMSLVAGTQKVTIVVSGTLAPGVRQRIDMLTPMLHGFTGELAVEEDAALLDQDCRVEWGNGYGERNTEALWKRD